MLVWNLKATCNLRVGVVPWKVASSAKNLALQVLQFQKVMSAEVLSQGRRESL
jgi:hypothetical protein